MAKLLLFTHNNTEFYGVGEKIPTGFTANKINKLYTLFCNVLRHKELCDEIDCHRISKDKQLNVILKKTKLFKIYKDYNKIILNKAVKNLPIPILSNEVYDCIIKLDSLSHILANNNDNMIALAGLWSEILIDRIIMDVYYSNIENNIIDKINNITIPSTSNEMALTALEIIQRESIIWHFINNHYKHNINAHLEENVIYTNYRSQNKMESLVINHILTGGNDKEVLISFE